MRRFERNRKIRKAHLRNSEYILPGRGQQGAEKRCATRGAALVAVAAAGYSAAAA